MTAGCSENRVTEAVPRFGVRKSGDRVRITALLNDVATGSHIWAEHYDRGLARHVRGAARNHRGHCCGGRAADYAAEGFRARRKPPDSMDASDH